MGTIGFDPQPQGVQVAAWMGGMGEERVRRRARVGASAMHAEWLKTCARATLWASAGAWQLHSCTWAFLTAVRPWATSNAVAVKERPGPQHVDSFDA